MRLFGDDVWRANDGSDSAIGPPRRRKSHLHIRLLERPTSIGVVLSVDKRPRWTSATRRGRLVDAVADRARRSCRTERYAWLRMLDSAAWNSSRRFGGIAVADRKRTVTDDWVVAVVVAKKLQQPSNLQSPSLPHYTSQPTMSLISPSQRQWW